jgi:hypothetical protein
MLHITPAYVADPTRASQAISGGIGKEPEKYDTISSRT